MLPDESQPITATIGGALDDYRLPLVRLGRPRKYLRPGETWDSLPPPRPKLMDHPKMPAPRFWAWEAARKKLRGCAESFVASPALRRWDAVRRDLQNIRRTTCGYQVVLTRNFKTFRKSVTGFGEESLCEAIRIRDAARVEAPPIKQNEIPREVLDMFGLEQPVAGIYRQSQRKMYRVDFRDAENKKRARYFYFRHVPEADAYAGAMAFLAEIMEGDGKGCRLLDGPVRDARILDVRARLEAAKS